MRRNRIGLDIAFPDRKELRAYFTVHPGVQGAVSSDSNPKNRGLPAGSIRPLAGTHGENHPHVELPQPFQVPAFQLVVVRDSAWPKIGAFSPHDNRWRRISTAVADAVH